MNKIIKKRQILAKIMEQLDNDLVLVLTGPRQTGKTTILKLIQEQIKSNKPETPTFMFDLEKPDVAKNFNDYQSAINFLLAQGIKPETTNILFLDEFQKMIEPTKTLKILHDHYPYLKIIATGSSSLDIYNKLRAESMAGRKKTFSILPLTFAEFLDFNPAVDSASLIWQRIFSNDIDPASVMTELNPFWEKYIIWGGYPRCALINNEEEKKQMLAELQQSYLERDIAGMLGFEDSAIFNRFVSLLAVQNGNLFNLNEITKISSLSRFKAEKFLLILEHTFIIKILTPFFTNKQKEIIKMPKIYFLDTGLRNWLTKNFSPLDLRPDAGLLAENAVFSELIKYLPLGFELHFWRTPQGTEADFIIQNGEKIYPVEVKYQQFDKPALPSGLKAFIKEYKSTKAFVLTKNFYGQITFEGCAVYFLPSLLAAKIFKLL